MAHVLLCLAITAGVVVPVTRLLMWRAWLKFNLKIIESQTDFVDTSQIAEAFLRPVFARRAGLRSLLTANDQKRHEPEGGES